MELHCVVLFSGQFILIFVFFGHWAPPGTEVSWIWFKKRWTSIRIWEKSVIVNSLCFDVNFIKLRGGSLKNKYKKWMLLLLIKKSQYRNSSSSCSDTTELCLLYKTTCLAYLRLSSVQKWSSKHTEKEIYTLCKSIKLG